MCRCGRVLLFGVETWSPDGVELPGVLGGGSTPFQAGPGYAEVLDALERVGCGWEPYGAGSFGDQVTLKARGTGTAFVFQVPGARCQVPGARSQVPGAGAEPVLHAVGVPGDGHGCPEGAVAV